MHGQKHGQVQNCIAASQTEISDFGQNPNQMPYLVRKSSEIITAGLKIFGGAEKYKLSEIFYFAELTAQTN